MSEADTDSAPSLLPPTPVESALTEEVPTPMPDEISRLHSFIRSLESELEASEKDMFKGLDVDVPVLESDDESDYRDMDIHSPMEQTSVSDVPITPMHELYRGFTPHQTPFPAHGSQSTPSLTRHQSDLDAFLLALAEAGYTNLDTSRRNPQEPPPTGLTTIANDFFFKSALYDGSSASEQSSPVDRNRLDLDSPSKNSQSNRGSRRLPNTTEMFTAESLRRNWDLEDEVDENLDEIARIQQEKVMTGNLSHLYYPSDSHEVEELSGKKGVTPVSSPDRARKTITTPSTTGKAKMDPRLHGDFNVWSGGFMLSSEYLHLSYVGMHPTSLTHYVDNGRLFVSTVQSSGEASGGDTNSLQKLVSTSAASTTNPNGSRKGSYFNLHVMECVLRPDRELKHIIMALRRLLTDKYQFRCVEKHSNHLVVTPPKATAVNINTPPPKTDGSDNNNGSNNGAVSEPSRSSTTLREWDLLDIQVCISKELRQRVLLVQFMRRVGSLLDHVTVQLLQQVSTTAQTPTNQNLLELLPLRQCPATRRLASQIKKALIAEQLSLSSLYAVPITDVCSLPSGLDNHFLAQLQTLIRDGLWTRLKAEYSKMEEHLAQEESEAQLFAKTLEAIYKAYGMKTQDIQYIRASSSSSATSSGQQVRRNSLTSAINSAPTTAHATRAYPLTSSMLSPTPFPLSSATSTPMSAADPLQTPLAPATHSRTNPVRDPGYKGEYTVSLTPAINALHEMQQQQQQLKSINSELTPPQTPPTVKRKSPPPHPLSTVNDDSKHPHEEGNEDGADTDASNPLATPPKKKVVYTGSLHGMPLTPGTQTAIYELSPASAKQHFMRSLLQRQHEESSLQSQSDNKNDEHPQQLSFSEEHVPADNPVIESTTPIAQFEEVMSSSPLPQNTSVRFADPLSMLLTTPPPPRLDNGTTMTPMSTTASGTKGTSSPAKTSSGPQQGSWVDGMVFCLIMLDKCFQERQNSCDAEFAEKMAARHSATLLVVQDILAHKRALLVAIVNYAKQAPQPCSLMKTFMSTFEGISITRFTTSRTSSVDIQRTASMDQGTIQPNKKDVQTTNKAALLPRSSFTAAFTGGSVTSASNNSNTTGAGGTSSVRNSILSFFKGGTTASSVESTNSSSTNSSSSGQTGGSSNSGDITVQGVAKGFKPRDQRIVLSPEEMARRRAVMDVLSDFSVVDNTDEGREAASGSDGDKRSRSASNSSETGSVQPTNRRPSTSGTSVIPFEAAHSIVLYYFTALVNSSQQGTVYVTAHHLCVVSSLMGFNQRKEVFALSDLTDILLPQQSLQTTPAAIASIAGGTTTSSTSSSVATASIASSSAPTSSHAVSSNGNTVPGSLFGAKSLRLVFAHGFREVSVTPLLIDCARAKLMITEIQRQFAAI